MVNVRFYPIDIDYREDIRIFGKTEEGKKIVVIDDSIQPYFYVDSKDEEINMFKDKISKLQEDNSYVTKTEFSKKDYLGKEIKLIKVYVNNESSISVIKNLIKKMGYVEFFEDDISHYKKYLIENNIIPLTLCEVDGTIKKDPFLGIVVEGKVKQVSEETLKPKILSFDIEVYSPMVALGENFSEPIISVALVGNNGFKKVLTWKEFKTDKDCIEFVKSESDLLIKLKNYIEEYSPDYIIGYYSDGFDFPYIIQRAERYGIEFDIGLDGSKIRVLRGDPKKVKIKGIVHLDILPFIRKIMSGSLKLDSYSLNNVANILLNNNKKDMDIWNMTNMWDNEDNIEKICEYNLHDALLTLKIFEKILPNLEEIVKLIGIPLFDISRMSYGQLIENYLIKKSKEHNVLIPKKPNYAQISERKSYTYQGAYVMEPKPGFYKNLVVFDFMSLYPTIIITKNISPSSFNLKGKGYESPLISDNGKENIYYFNNERKCFIPKVIEELINKRNEIKKELKKDKNPFLSARSYALKTVANACYGYMGFFGARWYCKQCVASITAWAREYIKEVIRKCEENGFEVLYSDTDSIAINLRDRQKKDAIDFVKEINQKLPGMMELELESFYPYGIFVSKKTETHGAKKKYALIDEKGEIKINGFETVRRDWSKLARNTQKKVLEILLKDNSPKKAKEYVNGIIEKLRKKDVPIKDLVIQTQLKMNLESYEQIGPHVAVAKRMKEKGFKITRGSPIFFVITEGNGMIRDRAKTPDEVQEGKYDTEYYINNQIIPVIEKIFEIFNIDKEELLIKGKQTDLGSF